MVRPTNLKRKKPEIALSLPLSLSGSVTDDNDVGT
jgi:hypothetical protein